MPDATSRDGLLKAVLDAARAINPKYKNIETMAVTTRFDELGIDSFEVIELLVMLESTLKVDLTRLTQMELKIMSIQDVVTALQSLADAR